MRKKLPCLQRYKDRPVYIYIYFLPAISMMQKQEKGPVHQLNDSLFFEPSGISLLPISDCPLGIHSLLLLRDLLACLFS